MNKISAVILTHNNEDTIDKCLKSITAIVDEIIVIDDFSTDDTPSILEKYKCTIYNRKLDNNFGAQRNFGIEKAMSDFILTIDSDEELDDLLASSIKNIILVEDTVYTCIRANKNFCGTDKVHLHRRPILMHKSRRFRGSLHEYVDYKKAIKIKGNIIHNSWKNFDYFINDINIYSSKKALDWHKQARKYSFLFLMFRQLLAFVYQFLYRYIIEMRFRHGVCGFLYCLFWASEELAVGLKYMELKKK